MSYWYLGKLVTQYSVVLDQLEICELQLSRTGTRRTSSSEARRLCAERDRRDIGNQKIEKVLLPPSALTVYDRANLCVLFSNFAFA